MIGKLRRLGPTGVAAALLRRVEARLGAVRRRIEAMRLLRATEGTARFLHDGGITLRLPPVARLRGLMGLDPGLNITADFIGSAGSEILLRHLVHRLYTSGTLDPGTSIIDIGCWCGDSSLPWAKVLTGSARVHAIDPAPYNLSYVRRVAAANGITNVTLHQAVCSDMAGERLAHTGPLEHASFHPAPDGGIVSTKLDDLIGEDRATIGLLHVDVEGFEARVLRGAARIIAESQPVIVYEQHLADDDLSEVFNWLTERGYTVFMVNEIMTNCRSDCRNFIGVPAARQMPADLTDPARPTRPAGATPATVGADLIRVAP